MTQRLLRAAALWALVVASASANRLTVVAAVDGACALSVNAGETSSALPIAVVSSDALVAAEDFLTGWQLTLGVAPEQGAIGEVSFASASQPAADYVFSGTSSLGVSVVNRGASLLAFDTQFPATGGVPAPTGDGSNLIDLFFQASSDAFGRFGLFAESSRGASEWTDAAQPIMQRRDFDNIPLDGGPIRIAEVFVSNPAIESQIRGDYNRDGDVDQLDYETWRRRFGETGSPTELFADGNLDGVVDASDYTIWRDSRAAFTSALAVPEPPSWTWLGLSGLAMIARKRKSPPAIGP